MKLKEITKLYGKHKDETIYIVGTGPSIRLFDSSFLNDKITIGLNQCWKLFRTTYSITIHPYLIPDPPYSTIWITKRKTNCKGWQRHIKLNHVKHFYLFDNNDSVDDITPLESLTPSRRLYVGRGIQTAAMHLAAILGARWAVLAGVPMGTLGDDHHGIDQHTEFHGIAPDEVYKEYYYYAVKVREELKKYYNIDFLTLTPFLGELYNNEDYMHQCQSLSLPPLPKPKEYTSGFPRKGNLVLDYIQ